MATLAMTLYLMECDGCQSTLGLPNGYSSATEARAAAYAEGWRYPPQPTKTGKVGARTFDVCPACLPEWRPEHRAASRTRAILMFEVEALRSAS